ncbi:hypothetical protein HNV11_06835 [Spirosoma taeanense]|uniref:Uncharacterized protein n=1 Tax=Spirosoma taeanense TaxID=2735870 RepID=A0A6M5Y5Q1_9BACT|nr:hypothetical protein [Spirosoma taeanense]QJW89125.1 hypothetical protein HNV11_06835 [Spirosoma taeanense]
MVESLVLIEGKNVKEESLWISLGNAKQLIVGSQLGFGVVLHIAATTPDDLRNALIDFAKVKNVSGVVTLMMRSQR